MSVDDGLALTLQPGKLKDKERQVLKDKFAVSFTYLKMYV